MYILSVVLIACVFPIATCISNKGNEKLTLEFVLKTFGKGFVFNGFY
jgi:hypothetical protein